MRGQKQRLDLRLAESYFPVGILIIKAMGYTALCLLYKLFDQQFWCAIKGMPFILIYLEYAFDPVNSFMDSKSFCLDIVAILSLSQVACFDSIPACFCLGAWCIIGSVHFFFSNVPFPLITSIFLLLLLFVSTISQETFTAITFLKVLIYTIFCTIDTYSNRLFDTAVEKDKFYFFRYGCLLFSGVDFVLLIITIVLALGLSFRIYSNLSNESISVEVDANVQASSSKAICTNINYEKLDIQEAFRLAKMQYVDSKPCV